jgi:gliding motility-associated-like protein
MDVRLSVRSAEGCENKGVLPDAISVFPVPKTAFNALPETAFITHPVIHFENRSEAATNLVWDFDDGSAPSDGQNPEHLFAEMGFYDVTLYTSNDFGCTDSTSRQVLVTFDKIFPPNAFSPNAVTEEDRKFRLYSEGMADEGYQLIIFNRWGEVIFESNSQENGWDGKMKNGNFAPAGVYTWVLRYSDFSGKKHRQNGSVTLVF